MKENNLETLAQDAALLSVCELGLGSILHGFRIPLAGYFLSLNQIFLLSRSVFKTRERKAPFIISSIATCFKSLSPVGKKLTPMLAISAQGFLLSIGTILFGPNLFGTILGGIFSSTWSFIQPLLIYYFVFGDTLIRALEYFYSKIQDSFSIISINTSQVLWIALVLITFKALLAVSIVLVAYFLPESYFQKWQSKLLRAAKRAPKYSLKMDQREKSLKENIYYSFKELMNPLFLISLVLTLCFFFFVEGSMVQAFWYGLRTIAIGFLLFFFIKYIPMENIEKRIPIVGLALQKIRLIKK
ncbi:MAG: hypothetical protein M9962_15170 [Oligoflexia bacterium]|nr:hypothetical protein [Oligoflexia bacterium]